ncbi:MAG: hypothetical protein WCT15_07805, partial [Candidatus Omnitrophota bacterium]
NITFYNFVCNTPDKEIYFEAGYTYTFLGSLDITGSPDIGAEEYYIKLRSQTEGQAWYMNVLSDTLNLNRINIRDAYAINSIYIPIGVKGSNNVNIEIDPVWDGGGTTNNWSDATNWDGNAVPSLTDPVTFNATSTKDCTIDNVGTWSGGTLTIAAGYTGIITLATDINIASYTQAAGTFNASTYTITCNGNFSITAGTFNAGTSTIILDATNGDILFTGAAYTFNNVIFQNTSSTTDRTITLSAGNYTFNGNFYLYATGTNGITVDAATNNPNLTIIGNIGMIKSTDLGLINGDFETGDLTGWIDEYGNVHVVSGDAHTGTYSLDMQRYITGYSALTQDISPVTLPSFSIWVKGRVEGCDHVQVYILDSTDTYQELYDFVGETYGDWTEVTFDTSAYPGMKGIKFGGYNDIGDVSTMLIDDISGGGYTGIGAINAGAGSWQVAGNIDLTNITLNAGSGSFVFNSTDTGKTIKSAGGSFNSITFNGVGGSWTLLDALTVSGPITITNGAVNTDNYNVTVNSYSQTNGVISAGSSTITCNGNFSVTGGTFTAGTSIIILNATNAGLTLTGNGYTFSTVIFKNTAAVSRTVVLGAGTMTFTNFYLVSSDVAGTILVDADTNDPDITITGNIGSYYTNAVSNPGFEEGDFTSWSTTGSWSVSPYNAHTGSYSAYSNIYASSGTLYQEGFDPASASSLNFWIYPDYISGTFSLKVYIKDASGYQLVDTITSLDYQWTEYSYNISSYSNVQGIKLEDTSTSGGYFFLDDVSIPANYGGTGAKTINAGSGTWTVGGNAYLDGVTFNAQASTVTFNGTGTSTIYGSNTFNNLKCTTPGKTINFEAAKTQTVSGTLTLAGTYDNPIILRSSSDG